MELTKMQNQMKKTSVRVGIIGYTGMVGPRHVKAWEAIGAKWEGCDSKCDWMKFIRKDFDIIDIATPIWLHPVMIREAVKAGKDVICEKPLAHNLKDAYDIIELSKQTKKKIGIIYQFRFNTEFLALKKEIEEGKYGEIKLATVNYYRYKGEEYFKKRWRGSKEEAGGGVVLNVTIHYLDQLQWLFGYPAKITGFTNTIQKGVDIEDTAVAVMKFPSGAIASVTLCSQVNPPKHMEFGVYGTKGYKVIQMRENEYHKENFEAFLRGEGYQQPVEAVKSLKMALSIIK